MSEETFTPDMNDGVNVFVFGSNLAGRHGKGAALEAAKHWGAEYGNGWGAQGNAYAIPTKNRSMVTMKLVAIRQFVSGFILYAKLYRDRRFLVTKIGCGLAGYKEEEIAPMFKGAPENCVLPKGWREMNGEQDGH